jgi:hypothetical protein
MALLLLMFGDCRFVRAATRRGRLTGTAVRRV